MTKLSAYFNKVIYKQKNPSLLTNALSNWLSLSTSVFVGFFLTPFIINQLGKTGFGIWTLISSIIGYYGILDLGVTSAITRYVARYAGQRDYKALNENINTSLAMFCVIGFVTVCVSFLIAGMLSKFFNIPSDQAEKFQHVVRLLGLATGLGFFSNFFGAVIRAHERFVAANLVTIITTLIRAILIVMLLSHGIGLVGIAYSHVLSAVLMITLNFALCKMMFSYLDIQLNKVRWSVLRNLLVFGAATTMLEVANIMRFNLDSFVIGKWINLPAVAVYGIAALLIRYFLLFIANGTQVVFTPRFAALDGDNKQDQLQQLFLKSLSIAAFLGFSLGTLIIILGRQFIVLWVGKDFLDAAPVLYILTVCYSIALAQSPGVSLVYALKKHYLFAVASMIEGIVNVVLSIYLAPRYGIIGVAMGTAVPMLVIKLLVQPLYISRIIGISLLCYWAQLLPALSLATGAIIIGLHTSQITILDNGYISLAVCAFLYLATFLLFYIFIYIIARRRDIKKKISSKVRKSYWQVDL